MSSPPSRKSGPVAPAPAETTDLLPIAADDIKRVTGLDVERVVATRSDVETVNKGFYDLQTSLLTAEKQLTATRMGAVDLGNQEFLSAEATELDPAAAPVVKALD